MSPPPPRWMAGGEHGGETLAGADGASATALAPRPPSGLRVRPRLIGPARPRRTTRNWTWNSTRCPSRVPSMTCGPAGRPPGAYSPSARPGRRGGGSGGVAGMVRRAGSDALRMFLRPTASVDSWAASIRRRSRPNTAFRFLGCFDMGNALQHNRTGPPGSGPSSIPTAARSCRRADDIRSWMPAPVPAADREVRRTPGVGRPRCWRSGAAESRRRGWALRATVLPVDQRPRHGVDHASTGPYGTIERSCSPSRMSFCFVASETGSDSLAVRPRRTDPLVPRCQTVVGIEVAAGAVRREEEP